jgi:hypothetical protein
MEINQNAEVEATKIRDELLEEARFIGSDSKAEAKLIVRKFLIARIYIHFPYTCVHLSLFLSFSLFLSSLSLARALSVSRARALSRSLSLCLKDTIDPQDPACLCARILLRIAERCSSEGNGPHRGCCRTRSAGDFVCSLACTWMFLMHLHSAKVP